MFPMTRFHFCSDSSTEMGKHPSSHERISLLQSFHLLMNTIQYFRFCAVSWSSSLDKAYIRPHAVYAFQIYQCFWNSFFLFVAETHLGNGCRRPTSKAAAQIPIKNYYVLFVTFVPLLQSEPRHNMITYRRAQPTKTKWKQQKEKTKKKRQKKSSSNFDKRK